MNLKFLLNTFLSIQSSADRKQNISPQLCSQNQGSRLKQKSLQTRFCWAEFHSFLSFPHSLLPSKITFEWWAVSRPPGILRQKTQPFIVVSKNCPVWCRCNTWKSSFPLSFSFFFFFRPATGSCVVWLAFRFQLRSAGHSVLVWVSLETLIVTQAWPWTWAGTMHQPPVASSGRSKISQSKPSHLIFCFLHFPCKPQPASYLCMYKSAVKNWAYFFHISRPLVAESS